MSGPEAEPASFRDPDSAVFRLDGRILRGLSARAADDWDRLAATSFFPGLVDDGKVVASTPYEGEAPPSPRGAPWSRVIEHERVPFVSYPYEWPFGMLRDAAELHLEVLVAALAEGFSTKDGTAYNVQFHHGRPVFIDVGSFEPANGPWPGYRQFCETLLFPLLIQAHLGIPFQPLLRGSVDGLPPLVVAPMFKGLRKWRKGVLRNVVLHGALERKVTTSSEQMKQQLRSAGFSVELAKAMTGKLLKLVRALEVRRSGSTWSDYRDTCTYTDESAAAKQRFVEEAVSGSTTRTVLDLGANDGAYSFVAAGHTDLVIAVDGDEAVIDALYRRVRAEGVTNVLPLVMNLVDPSPGIGWRNRERAPFAERVQPDVVLALALVHHLAIGANVPLPQVVDWLRSFDARTVVEFVDPTDPMAQRLLSNKPAGLFDDYCQASFEALVAGQFDVCRREVLPGATRTLYLLEPRP